MNAYLTVFFAVINIIAKYGPTVAEAIANQWKDEGKDVTLEDIEALKTSDAMETIKTILGAKAYLLEQTDKAEQ